MKGIDKTTISELANKAISRCKTLSAISAMKNGILRTYLSKEHKACNAQVSQWMEDAGMQTWQDSVGNQWGRIPSLAPNAKRLIIGSHLDTVPNAGAYDGILGVMLAIALAELANKSEMHLPFHLDVVGFCDEEGTRFATTLIGSKALAGQFDPAWLSITDDQGITMEQAMIDFGLQPSAFTESALDNNEVLAYWEAHIEQGPVLEHVDKSLGIVSAIAGAKRAIITCTGSAGHAGTTPINLRHDALTATAELVIAIEKQVKTANNGEVATVGQINAMPGATNVIAGKVVFSLDARAQSDDDLTVLLNHIQAQAQLIAQQRGISFDWQWTHQAAAVACDPSIISLLQKACDISNEEVITLPSGAGHDAMAIAEICPVGMLFLRSPGGISHHPKEAIIDDDVTKALQVFFQALLLQKEKALH